MKKLASLGIVTALSLVGVNAADAGTSTSNMTVSASVSASCTISAGSLTFGAYDTVSGGQVDGAATVTVACTKDSTSTVTLGQGSNAAAGSTDAAPLRRMTDGAANALSYALYLDSGRTAVWGNTAGTGKSYTAPSSAASTLTVYGRILSSQDVPAGSYSDTVVATITF